VVYGSSSGRSNGDTNTSATTKNDNLDAAAKNCVRREEDDWKSKNGASAEDEIWTCTWTVWIRIATVATATAEVSDCSKDQLPSATVGTTTGNTADERRNREYQPQSLQHKQQFLTALLQIFPLIFTRIKTR